MSQEVQKGDCPIRYIKICLLYVAPPIDRMITSPPLCSDMVLYDTMTTENLPHFIPFHFINLTFSISVRIYRGNNRRTCR